MIKEITHKSNMLEKVQQGMSEIAGIVKQTLGPGGLPILLERQGQALDGSPLDPIITKDGVTVASECRDEDPQKDIVIQSVKAICKKTNRVAGDGTTTAIVLGEAILSTSLELMRQDPTLNPQQLRLSLEAASRDVSQKLSEHLVEVSDLKQIEEIAIISANGDREVGSIIRQAFERVGDEGIITVDEGNTSETTIEIIEGYQFRRGAEGHDRFFNTAGNTKFEAENVHVILYDGKLMSYTDLLSSFNAIAENYRKGLPPILVVAHEFSNEVVRFLLMQKAEMGLAVCAVKAPHTTSVRTAMLDDLGVMLGGERLGNGNKNMQSAAYDDIGIANRVVIDKYTTTLYGGQGAEEGIIDRIEQLKQQQSVAESPYDAQLLKDRAAALQNGIAKIGVGGATEMEVKERYHRIEDALNAARAAISEGVIPGGGSTLLRVASELNDKPNKTIGETILSAALTAPFFQILENIGITDDAKLKEIGTELISSKTLSFNGVDQKVVDAFEAGLIDPVKVTRSALQNATSIAGLLVTCGGAITFKRAK